MWGGVVLCDTMIGGCSTYIVMMANSHTHYSERVVTNADLIKASKLHPICTALLKAYFKISLACPMFKAC